MIIYAKLHVCARLPTSATFAQSLELAFILYCLPRTSHGSVSRIYTLRWDLTLYQSETVKVVSHGLSWVLDFVGIGTSVGQLRCATL